MLTIFSDPEFKHTVIIVALMVITGTIGSFCRHVLDKTDKMSSLREIIVPGVVAAFIVPLFLSIGKNDIFSNTIKGIENYYSNIFIIVAFCLLAGASARNFVDAMAKDALRAANRAEEAASRAEQKAEKAGAEAAETKDIVAEDIEPASSIVSPASAKIARESLLAHAEGLKKLLIETFLDHPNKARVLSSLSKEMQKPESEVLPVLKKLVDERIVKTWISDRTSSRLYRLELDGN